MKYKNRFDHQVIVDIKEPYSLLRDTKDEDWLEAAETLIESIKRHCDGVGHVCYHYSEEDLCSFCGSEWFEYDEEDEKDDPECEKGMPYCCGQAQDEWLEKKNNKE